MDGPYGLPPARRSDPAYAAIAAIRAYCGWHVAPVVRETLHLTTPASTRVGLLIPSGHVREVHRVTVKGTRGDDGRDITSECEWGPAGLIRRHGGPLAASLSGVEIELTHGYDWDQVPDLVSVYEAVRERAGRVAAPIRSQTAGSYSVTYATVDGVPIHGAALLSTEKTLLARYKLEWGP